MRSYDRVIISNHCARMEVLAEMHEPNAIKSLANFGCNFGSLLKASLQSMLLIYDDKWCHQKAKLVLCNMYIYKYSNWTQTLTFDLDHSCTPCWYSVTQSVNYSPWPLISWPASAWNSPALVGMICKLSWLHAKFP